MALVTVEDVLSYLGHDAEQDAFWVYYSGAAATATAQIVLDKLDLWHDAVNDANWDLTAAAYDTVGELVAAINVLAGWEAGIICHSGSTSTDLLETGQLDALGSANEQTLIITGDYVINELILAATDLINRCCHKTLEATEHGLERYDGGEAKLFLNNYPVIGVYQVCQGTIDVIRVRCTDTTAYNAYVEVDQGAQTVKLMRDGTTDANFDISNALYDTLAELATAINGTANWTGTIQNTTYNAYPCTQLFTKYNVYCKDYYNYLKIPDRPIDAFDVDYEDGIIHLSSEFAEGFQNIYVSYYAGYATIPAALKQICIELVKYKYNLIGKDASLKSEKIGRVYAYTMGDIDAALSGTPGMLADLELFKSRLV